MFNQFLSDNTELYKFVKKIDVQWSKEKKENTCRMQKNTGGRCYDHYITLKPVKHAHQNLFQCFDVSRSSKMANGLGKNLARRLVESKSCATTPRCVIKLIVLDTKFHMINVTASFLEESALRDKIDIFHMIRFVMDKMRMHSPSF